jgi:hypothetical protein
MTGPPIKVESRPPHKDRLPTDTFEHLQRTTVSQLRARRATSWRLPVLDHSGRSDPWHYEPPGERGYPQAALHLLELGLTPAPNREGLRLLWRRGGHSRQAAEFIAQAWELVAA